MKGEGVVVDRPTLHGNEVQDGDITDNVFKHPHCNYDVQSY